MKRELQENLAKNLCFLSGWDPTGCDGDLWLEEGICPEDWENWHAFKRDAKAAISLVTRACIKLASTKVIDHMDGNPVDGKCRRIEFERQRTPEEMIKVLASLLPDGEKIEI